MSTNTCEDERALMETYAELDWRPLQRVLWELGDEFSRMWHEHIAPALDDYAAALPRLPLALHPDEAQLVTGLAMAHRPMAQAVRRRANARARLSTQRRGRT